MVRCGSSVVWWSETLQDQKVTSREVRAVLLATQRPGMGAEPVKGIKLGRKTPLCFEDVIKDEVRFNLALFFSAQLKRRKDQDQDKGVLSRWRRIRRRKPCDPSS